MMPKKKKKKNKKNNDMNKKNLSSFTNARDSVSDDETLAPKFIPGFNVKGVSSKPLYIFYHPNHRWDVYPSDTHSGLS